MNQTTDFAEVFSRLARDGRTEESMHLGGVNVRLVRVKGGGEGRWDHHDRTTETVVVWSGDFSVEFVIRPCICLAANAALCRLEPSTGEPPKPVPRSSCSSRLDETASGVFALGGADAGP